MTPNGEATPPWDAARVNLTSKELAPGVFAVMPDDVLAKDHVATTAGFVIGERGVLVIESMLNGDLASQLIGLVRRATTKPIRYLVNTSYHGDHAYGNFLFPDTAVVIQHPATKKYMEENFEEDRRFMIGLMGQGKGIERVQPRTADIAVPEMLSVELGGRIVEVRHFGFAQTPGDLVIWVPDAKVLWVGNMIQAPSPALPWLLEGRHEETIATLARVRDSFPRMPRSSPAMGGRCVRRISSFRFAIYASSMVPCVRRSPRGNPSRTRSSAAAMPEYGEYSLFEWAIIPSTCPPRIGNFSRQMGASQHRKPGRTCLPGLGCGCLDCRSRRVQYRAVEPPGSMSFWRGALSKHTGIIGSRSAELERGRRLDRDLFSSIASTIELGPACMRTGFP